MARLTIGRGIPGPVPDPVTTVPFSGKKYFAHVYVKENWGDAAWTRVQYLQVVTSLEAVLPTRSTAEFVYDFGRIKREDRMQSGSLADPFERYEAGKLRDLFVAVRVIPEGGEGYLSWVGVIPVEQLELHATKTISETTYPAGRQTLTAYGLEYLLERRRLVGAEVSQVVDPPDPAQPFGSLHHIDWTPSFNRHHVRGQSGIIGNRAGVFAEIGSWNVPVFGNDFIDPADPARVLWSNLDILTYLFFFTTPLPRGLHEPEFIAPSLTDADNQPTSDELVIFFDAVKSVVEAGNQTVKGILDILLKRTRGIGGYFEAIEHDDLGLPKGKVELRLFSMVDEAVAIDNSTVPANKFVETIELDAGIDKQSAVVTVDSTTLYDRILVRGARTVVNFSAAVFNLAPTDPEMMSGAVLAKMEIGWTDAQEKAYKAMTDVQRKALDKSPVYRLFRFPNTFDWLAGFHDENGVVGTPAYLNPQYDSNGRILFPRQNGKFWNATNYLLPRLTIVDLDSPLDAGGGFDFIETFAVFKIERGRHKNRWIAVDHPPEGIPQGQIHVSKQPLALEVRYSEPHILADLTFNTREILPDYSLGPMPRSTTRPVFDYRKMIFTVCAEADGRPIVDVPLAHTPKRERTLIIDMPEVEVWFMPYGTVTGVRPDGTLRLYGDHPQYPNPPEPHGPEPEIGRDDTQRLRSVAALAKAFYAKPRSAVEVTLNGLFRSHAVGTFLDSLFVDEQRTEIKAPVTSRKLDYVKRTTTIMSSFIEMDMQRV